MPEQTGSSEDQRTAEPTTQAFDRVRPVTPGPNAFALRDRARMEHHIAGNAFAAAQAQAKRPQPLTTVHPAFRAPSTTPSPAAPSGSEPAMPKSTPSKKSAAGAQAASPHPSPPAPARSQASTAPSTPLRSFLNRLKGVSTRNRRPSSSQSEHEQLPQAHDAPSTPLAARQHSNSITTAGPTPPAKNTPPAQTTSTPALRESHIGDIDIAYAESVGEDLRLDVSSGGLLPFFGGNFEERIALADSEMSGSPLPQGDIDGMLLSPNTYRRSVQSSETAAVSESLSGTIKDMVRQIVKEELREMFRADIDAMKMAMKQTDVTGAAQTDFADKTSSTDADQNADAPQKPYSGAGKLWAADLLDDRSREELRAIIVDQLRELYTMIEQYTERISGLVDIQETHVTEIATLQHQHRNLAGNLARVGIEATKQSNEFDVVHTVVRALTDRIATVERKISNIERCQMTVQDMHSQLYGLSLIMPDDFLISDDIRRMSADLRADILARAGDHPVLSRVVQHAMPGQVGYMAWVVDVLRHFLPRLEKIEQRYKRVQHMHRQLQRAFPMANNTFATSSTITTTVEAANPAQRPAEPGPSTQPDQQ